MAANTSVDTVVIFINGRKILVQNADPEATLAHFLRQRCGLTGTKIGCSEGGCGSCTVMISRYTSSSSSISNFAVNSCLLPLVSLHGYAVTTVEGVGGTRSKLHPVQERLASSHGTQCGFCSPGMVMSMYSLLRNSPHPTQQQIEQCLIGNLCRCTGYRPILDGFQAFSTSPCAMGEACCKNQKSTDGDNGVPAAAVSDDLKDRQQDYIFPPELKLVNYASEERCYKGERVTWYQPTTLTNLLELKAKFPKSKIICANTDIGIGNNLRKPLQHTVVISTSGVQELATLQKVDNSGIWVGSAVTISQLERILEEQGKQLPASQTTLYRVILADVLSWFACAQIKNVASVVGNLLVSKGQSDLVPICVAAGVELKLASADGSRTVKLSDEMFRKGAKSPLTDNEVVESLLLPFSVQDEHFRCYKQANRKSVDGAIVNSAFRVKFAGQKVSDIHLVFGGLESRQATTFFQTAQKLTGRQWNDELLEDAIKYLTEELETVTSPGDPLTSPTDPLIMYRKTLVLSFFYKFYTEISQCLSAGQSGGVVEKGEDVVSQRRSIQVYNEQGEVVEVDGQSQGDVGKPLAHKSAVLHTTGEAQYVDDMPSYPDELQMAFVYSEVAHATITSVDTAEALSAPGVKGYISAADVPGSNKWGMINDEFFFAEEKVTCVGQIVGAVVADTRRHAQIAAGVVKMKYSKLPSVLTIKQAIAENSFYEPDPVMLWKGDVAGAFSSADVVAEGEMDVGGQDHFYMETQVTLCVPKENLEMDLYSSTQVPTSMQSATSIALNVPSSRLNVKVKRLGGGFGGKQRRSLMIAVPTAIAAHKYGVSVRCSLDRDEDMLITGGREPLYAKYKVGYNKNGKIVALDIELYSNAGCTLDISKPILCKGMYSSDNAYNIANMRVRGWVCKTNTPSNAACRGLSAPQTMLIMENIITEIAADLDIPAHQIQQLNLRVDGDLTVFGQPSTNCNIQRCYDQVMQDSNFLARLKEVEKFNSVDAEKRRGVAIVPTQYPVLFDPVFLNQAGALVNVYADGNVLLTHGGTELGQGLHTKIIQIASRALGISSDKIYLQDVSTAAVPNSIVTGASSGTDLNGAAVLNACLELNKRLEPFKQVAPDASWEDWVRTAFMSRVSLSAQGFHSTPDITDIDWSTSKGSPFPYFTCGAAVSEVEVDCLTGHHQVLRTDIVMDAGMSINPAIDIGQIEGAFVQGYGLFCLEQVKIDDEGTVTSTGPATYKIPTIDNIPREFNVSLLKNSTNDKAIYSSKTVGEPPLFLASSVFLAIKSAVRSARESSGTSPKGDKFIFNSPCTPDKIRMSCSDRFTTTVTGRGGRVYLTHL